MTAIGAAFDTQYPSRHQESAPHSDGAEHVRAAPGGPQAASRRKGSGRRRYRAIARIG
jgi:hypothetical protein